MKTEKNRPWVSKFSYYRFQGTLGVQLISSAATDIGTQFLETPFKQNEV
jgi:hypothetical protein